MTRRGERGRSAAPKVAPTGPTERITRISAAEARTRRGKTDWARVDATTDEEIERYIAEDPDTAPELDAAWFARATVMEPTKRKEAISLRVDPDVLSWFRNSGPKWQSRMNRVLRAYVEHLQAKSRAETFARQRDQRVTKRSPAGKRRSS
jgi:uncharacterized protein (DUF4415 family)